MQARRWLKRSANRRLNRSALVRAALAAAKRLSQLREGAVVALLRLAPPTAAAKHAASKACTGPPERSRVSVPHNHSASSC